MPDFEIDSPSKRARLLDRRNPYWSGIGGGRGGVSLGYRKPASGPGSWIGKIVVEGRRVEERIGLADDKGLDGGLNYRAAVAEALVWSKRQLDAFAAREDDRKGSPAPTVRTAVEAYVTARRRRDSLAGRDASNRLARHVLADEKFASLALSKLRAKSIEAWRGRLPNRGPEDVEGLAPSTVNRLLNDLRAALNAAAELHRRELPPGLLLEIKIGTRATSTHSNARKQLLSGAETCRLIDAAFALDEDGDFGRLVLMLAATGARYSQVARIRVGELQVENSRVLLPHSAKGKAGGRPGRISVPLPTDVVERLAPAVVGRGAEEVLLMRWRWKQLTPTKWEKIAREPWGPSHMVRPWGKIREAAEMPADTIPYAFRHSSIVRGLRAGLPIRLVASLHDTSVAMIEAHYSAFITDATEDLARRAMLTLSGS